MTVYETEGYRFESSHPRLDNPSMDRRISADVGSVRAPMMMSPGRSSAHTLRKPSRVSTDGPSGAVRRLQQPGRAQQMRGKSKACPRQSKPAETVGPRMGVKASGGVRDQAAAQAMIKAGATRIGASASIAIATGMDAGKGKY